MKAVITTQHKGGSAESSPQNDADVEALIKAARRVSDVIQCNGLVERETTAACGLVKALEPFAPPPRFNVTADGSILDGETGETLDPERVAAMLNEGATNA